LAILTILAIFIEFYEILKILKSIKIMKITEKTSFSRKSGQKKGSKTGLWGRKVPFFAVFGGI
jgi:hypothetical protein